MKNPKRIATNILLSMISIGGAVFITNFAAERIGLGNPLLYRPDSLVGYRLAPNQKEKRRNNATVTVNSEGFRIDPSSTASGNKSIVFVGDSVTYGGSYIDDKDLFSSIFCRDYLDSACFNSGINSWGTLNMARFVKYFDLYSTQKVDRFILVVLPGDETRNLRSLGGTPYWTSKPVFPSAINEIISYLTWRYFYRSLRSGVPSQPEASPKIKSAQLKESWKDLFRYIGQSEARVDLAITPPKRWFENPNAYHDEISYYESIIKNYANLYPSSKSCHIYQPLKAEYSTEWYVDGVHLSESGHRSWAKTLNKCLQ